MSKVATNNAKAETKVFASNAFGALYDDDSGDDVVNNAVKQLEKVSIGSKPDNTHEKNNNSKNGKEKENGHAIANNRNSRGGNQNRLRYQNGANGWRSTDQRAGGFDGHSNRYQNGWYRGNKSSSSSSNVTEDGASDKAEKSSAKSLREQREEEFQQKLKEFKYDPQMEETKRKSLAKFSDILPEKDAAIKRLEVLSKEEEESDGELSQSISEKLQKAREEKEQLLKERSETLEYLKLCDSKKITLAEYEKMKEERRKAQELSNAERRVVPQSEFDGMVVVAKKNLDDDLSFKPRTAAEKHEKAEKKKKKFVPVVTVSGSQSLGRNNSEQRFRRDYRGGPRNEVRPVEQNAGPKVSPYLGSADIFPSLGFAPGA